MGVTLLRNLGKPFAYPIDEDNRCLRAEQLGARLRMYPVMISGQLLLAPLFVWMLWEQAAPDALLAWLAGFIAVLTLELTFWARHRQRSLTVAECHILHTGFLVFTPLVGLFWGGAAFGFFPEDLAYQAFVICVMLGLLSGAVTMNPVHPPSQYLYVASISLPLLIRVVLAGDTLHFILAAMLLLFLVVVLNAGRELSATFRQALEQRFENAGLVQQLMLQKSRAETASRDKSRFLAAASHDLRQPLQALVLFSDALQDAAREPDTRKLAMQIDKSVHALVGMFDELLDISRLEAGVVEPRRQHFELQPLLDRIYGDFAPLAQSKGLEFDVPVGDWVVFSDPFLVQRILSNLVSNAVRYTDRGKVQVTCREAQDGWRMTVVDTGIGISEAALPHIFEEYYQVDNPHRDRRKGLGLGLAIVRRVEALLGIKVGVTSVPGEGSAFSFVIPKGEPDKLVQPFVITYSRYDLQGKTVALLEDDPEIREMIEVLLAQWGCGVVAGEYPEDVMRKLDVARRRPDIMLCDYRLPQGRTALHAMRQLHELWGDVPVLVLTGDTGQDALQEIRDSGATLLHKPITAERLRAMMHFLLQGAA